MIRLQRLAQNVPHQPLEEGYEQAGSSSLQLRRESTPHATLGPDMIQSTQPITNAKPRLLHRSVPGNVTAKRGMGQQQLGQKMGNLQKKILPTARVTRSTEMHPQLCSKRTTPQKTQSSAPRAWPGLHETLPSGQDTSSPRPAQWSQKRDKHSHAQERHFLQSLYHRRNPGVQSSRSQFASVQATNPETMQPALGAEMRGPPVPSPFAAGTALPHGRTLLPMPRIRHCRGEMTRQNLSPRLFLHTQLPSGQTRPQHHPLPRTEMVCSICMQGNISK